LYSTSSIVRGIKSRRMRCVNDAALIGQMKLPIELSLEIIQKRDHLSALGVGGRII
jgi:hypothetical protein